MSEEIDLDGLDLDGLIDTLDTGNEDDSSLGEGVSKNDDGTYKNVEGQRVNIDGTEYTASNDDGDSNNDDDSDDNKSAEDKFRDSILKKYKAIKFDDKGNAVDANGTVLADIDTLEKEFGKDVDTSDSTGLDKTLKALSSNLGFSPLDENNAPKKYTSVKDYLSDYSISQRQSGIDSLLDSHPQFRRIYTTLATGGKLEDLSGSKDWNSVNIAKEDTAQHKSIIVDSLVARGIPKELASTVATNIVETKDSFIEATNAKKELVGIDAQKMAAQESQIALSQQAETKQIKDYWLAQEAKVKSGQIVTTAGTIKLDKTTADTFHKYRASSVDANGNSQARLDYQNLSDEDAIMMDYLLFKKLSVADLAKDLAQKEKVKSLRELLSKSTSTQSQSRQNPEGLLSLDDVDLGKFL